MTWRPLSKRGQSDPRLDEPTEGLPDYLWGPVAEWVQESCIESSTGQIRVAALKRLQLRFKLDPSLNWKSGVTARQSLLQQMDEDEEFGLDVIDYMLHHIVEFTDQYGTPMQTATGLASILAIGGSAWEVAATEDPSRFQLSRRAVGPVREAIENIPASSRAHNHLAAAWNRLTGRNPDASGAYREAVRAVEAAAKPVVLPANDRATLGQMIAALRDRPEKWKSRVVAVELVRQMMESVWTGQLDRHGTDDEEVPLNVSLEEADAAFYICLGLVRLFTGGHITTS